MVLLRQLSYAIKNQLDAPKASYWGLLEELAPTRDISCLSLGLYDIRIGDFCLIIDAPAKKRIYYRAPLCLMYDIRELASAMCSESRTSAAPPWSLLFLVFKYFLELFKSTLSNIRGTRKESRNIFTVKQRRRLPLNTINLL